MLEYKIIVPLIQHTPILHFQGEYADDGAALRATELKPKLDRFITVNYPESIPAEWKIGETEALNYKLKITTISPAEVKNGRPPMFFGEGKSSLQIPHKDNSEQIEIQLEIFCLIESLYNYLDSIDWCVFFLANNFGTRQSKGYGSFYPSETEVLTDIIGRNIKIGNGVSYRVDSYFSPVFEKTSVTWEDIMKCINDVYKCFRSGINEGGLYFKSLMFAYAKSNNGEWWDKRTIKEIYFPKKLEEHRKKHPNRIEPDPLAETPIVEKKDYYHMFRDNLGLASFENWKDYGMKITKRGLGIARFQSPFLFKPIFANGKWYVFLLHREIPQRFKDTTFTVKVGKIEETIQMKPFPGFTMAKYLNYILSIDDYEQYIEVYDVDAEKRANGILNDLEEIRDNYKKIE